MLRRISPSSAVLAAAALCLLACAARAQGDFNGTFGSGGAAAYTIPAGEEIIGADLQDTGALADKIIVATMAYSTNTYRVRRFDKNTGALDTSFASGSGTQAATFAGTGAGGAVAVRGGGNEIYVAGRGPALNVCTVVRFAAQGNAAPQAAHFNLPAPINNCNVGFARISGGKLYVSGISVNTTTSKPGMTTLRYNIPALTLDPTWGSGGMVRTEVGMPGASVTQPAGLAFDGPTVYVAARLNAPGPLSGTIVVGYNVANGQIVGGGFGNRNINLTPGSGVYVVSALLGEDMVSTPGRLFLNGRLMTQPGDNFALVKLTLPAAQANYAAADFTGFDIAQRLVAVDANNVISGGQVKLLPSNEIDVGLGRYAANTTALTASWLPPFLVTLQPGGPTLGPTLGPATADLRRLTTGPTDELILKSLIMRYGLNKLGLPVPDSLIVVAHRGGSGAVHQIWLGRLRVN